MIVKFVKPTTIDEVYIKYDTKSQTMTVAMEGNPSDYIWDVYPSAVLKEELRYLVRCLQENKWLKS